MNNTTTFETAKVGDRVWSIPKGWGEIIEIDNDPDYPLSVRFDSGRSDCFTIDGRVRTTHSIRSLFWDEVKAPPQPLPKLGVDTKVLVWDVDKRNAIKRYFSHFDAHGRVYVFARGTTSWSGNKDTISYSHWELAE